MKKSLLILCLLFSVKGFSQCGKWVIDKVNYSKWECAGDLKTEKIKNYIKHAHDTTNYTYTDFKLEPNTFKEANICRCGCGEEDIYSRSRIEKSTGIKDMQYKFVRYKYEP